MAYCINTHDGEKSVHGRCEPKYFKVGDFKNSKIGIKWGTYFSKKVPNFETFWFTPAMHRPLTVKGYYVVSHSWYVQVYERVCTYTYMYTYVYVLYLPIRRRWKLTCSSYAIEVQLLVTFTQSKVKKETWPQNDTHKEGPKIFNEFLQKKEKK